MSDEDHSGGELKEGMKAFRMVFLVDHESAEAVKLGKVMIDFPSAFPHKYFSQSLSESATSSLADSLGSIPISIGHSMPTSGSFHRRQRSVETE